MHFSGVVDQLARASRLASELFFDNILQGFVLEAEVGEHLLQPPALILHLFETSDVRRLHTAIFGFPVVVRGI